MWIIILIVILAFIAMYVVSTYNGLVVARNKVKDQFSQIDIQLKRRFDLIPNLVETVKGYAKHESETLESVIQARNNYANAKTDAEKVAASNEMSRGVMNIMALSESYPDLKANTNFIQLQDELAGTENRISVARNDYNEAVKTYNKNIKSFPKNILAGMFGFEEKDYFEAKESSNEVPEVSFE